MGKTFRRSKEGEKNSRDKSFKKNKKVKEKQHKRFPIQGEGDE
jgi:hypothetical protein